MTFRYIRHTVSLFADGDLQTDPSIICYKADKRESVTPFRLGSSANARRDAPPRYPPQAMISQSAQAAQQAQAIMAANGQPMSISQLKAVQQQQQLQLQQQHMRISGTRPMPVATAPSASPPHSAQQHAQQGSPPNPPIALGARQNSPPNVGAQAVVLPNGVRPIAPATDGQQVYPVPNGSHVPTAQQEAETTDSQQASFQPRPQPQALVQQAQQPVQPPQQQQQPQVNGFHGYNAQYLPQTHTQSSLSVAQMQNLKNVFAAQGDAGRVAAATAAAFAIPNSVNMNLKIPPGRQWTHQQQHQPPPQPAQTQPRPTSAMDNGVTPMNGVINGASMSPPSINGVLPMRSPSRVQQMRPGVPQTSPRLQPAQGGY